MKGTSSFTSAGVTSETGSTPQALAEVMRRVSSCIRSSVRATSMPAGLGEDAELLVLANAVERERRHLLRVVDREDEVRGVAGRAARVRQRALLEEHEVAPAQARRGGTRRSSRRFRLPMTTARALAGKRCSLLLIYQSADTSSRHQVSIDSVRARAGSPPRSRRRAGASRLSARVGVAVADRLQELEMLASPRRSSRATRSSARNQIRSVST